MNYHIPDSSTNPNHPHNVYPNLKIGVGTYPLMAAKAQVEGIGLRNLYGFGGFERGND